MVELHNIYPCRHKKHFLNISDDIFSLIDYNSPLKIKMSQYLDNWSSLKLRVYPFENTGSSPTGKKDKKYESKCDF